MGVEVGEYFVMALALALIGKEGYFGFVGSSGGWCDVV